MAGPASNFTKKFSEFNSVGSLDESVGLESGTNARTLGGGGGGGGSECCEKTVIQDIASMPPATKLYVGGWVRFDIPSLSYQLALGDNDANANVRGVVKSIAADEQSFVLQQSGPNSTTFTGLTLGDYYLSTTVLGGMTLSRPMNDDEVDLPLFSADSASTGWVLNFRGKLLGDDGSGGGGGNGTSLITIPGTGFNIGDAVYVTGSNTVARADNASETTAEVAGVVVAVDAAAPSFTVQTEGYANVFGSAPAPLNNLTPGARYWLDTGGTSPNLTITKPTDETAYKRPVLIALTSTSAFILQRWPLQDADGPNIRKVTQNNHMFPEGYIVRPSTVDENQWVAAQADSIANATDAWLVIDNDPDGDGNAFIIQQSGFTDKIPVVGGGTTGAIGYLDASNPGVAVFTEPTATGEASLPFYRLTDSTTTPRQGNLLNVRPMLQPGANGGGGGGKVLLKEIDATAMSQATFDFSTVFSDFPTYKRYRLEWDDMYNDDAILGGYVVKIEVYIGAVLQTTGYTSSETTRDFGYSDVFTGQTSVTYIPITGEPTTGGCYNSLTLAHSGLLDFLSPLTNGSSKVMRGRFDGYGNINTHRLSGNIIGCMIGNTMPLQGFRISLVSGGSTELFGCFRVYGISE